jgi:hypothetical protein
MIPPLAILAVFPACSISFAKHGTLKYSIHPANSESPLLGGFLLYVNRFADNRKMNNVIGELYDKGAASSTA